MKWCQMTRTFRWLLIIFLLVPLASSGSPDVHSGWFREVCSFSSFHFSNIKELGAGEELVLHVGHGFPGPQLGTIVDASPRIWMDVSAERCVSDAKCEPIKNAKIWFEPAHGELKRLVGKYTFELGPQHIEGNFVARNRKPRPMPLCE